MDESEKVAQIESVACDSNYFYCVSNKRDEKLGLFLFMIDMNNPDKPAEYLLHWQNKLNIGNCDVAFMREEVSNGEDNTYLIVSYKAIGINTFNVLCINLKTKLIEYWHESN